MATKPYKFNKVAVYNIKTEASVADIIDALEKGYRRFISIKEKEALLAKDQELPLLTIDGWDQHFGAYDVESVYGGDNNNWIIGKFNYLASKSVGDSTDVATIHKIVRSTFAINKGAALLVLTEKPSDEVAYYIAKTLDENDVKLEVFDQKFGEGYSTAICVELNKEENRPLLDDESSIKASYKADDVSVVLAIDKTEASLWGTKAMVEPALISSMHIDKVSLMIDDIKVGFTSGKPNFTVKFPRYAFDVTKEEKPVIEYQTKLNLLMNSIIPELDRLKESEENEELPSDTNE